MCFNTVLLSKAHKNCFLSQRPPVSKSNKVNILILVAMATAFEIIINTTIRRLKYIPSITGKWESILRGRAEIEKTNSGYSLSRMNGGMFVHSIWKSRISM